MEIDDEIYLIFIFYLVLVFNHDFSLSTGWPKKVSYYHES